MMLEYNLMVALCRY